MNEPLSKAGERENRREASIVEVRTLPVRFNEENSMTIYNVVKETWNLEYGYEEYSKPIAAFSTHERAEAWVKENECNPEHEYEELLIVPIEVDIEQ